VEIGRCQVGRGAEGRREEGKRNGDEFDLGGGVFVKLCRPVVVVAAAD
jgi:hypothetical protein